MRRPKFLSRFTRTEKYLNTKLNLTPLEDRITPDATVVVESTLTPGRVSVTVNGDNTANDIRFQVVDGAFKVIVNGKDITPPEGINALSVDGLTINGGSANDVISTAGLNPDNTPGLNIPQNALLFSIFSGLPKITINGNGGADQIQGGLHNESMNGGDGNDLLNGAGGDDLLNGNADADQLFGGSGGDIIEGTNKDSILDGGTGENQLIIQKDLTIPSNTFNIAINPNTTTFEIGGFMSVAQNFNFFNVQNGAVPPVVNILNNDPVLNDFLFRGGFDRRDETQKLLDAFNAPAPEPTFEMTAQQKQDIANLALGILYGFRVDNPASVFINTGPGDQKITINGGFASPTTVDAGAGNDEATQDEVVSDDIASGIENAIESLKHKIALTNVESIQTKPSLPVESLFSNIEVNSPGIVFLGQTYTIEVSFTVNEDNAGLRFRSQRRTLDDGAVQADRPFTTGLAPESFASDQPGPALFEHVYSARKGERVKFSLKKIAENTGLITTTLSLSKAALNDGKKIVVDVLCVGPAAPNESVSHVSVDERTNEAQTATSPPPPGFFDNLIASANGFVFPNATQLDKTVQSLLQGLNAMNLFFGDPIALDVGFDGRNVANGGVTGADVAAERFTAFTSTATNLVFGIADTLQTTADVFVRDSLTGQTSLISKHTTGTKVAGGQHSNPKISRDGRFVVFEGTDSLALTGVVDGNAGLIDVFWHDRLTGITKLISMNNAKSASGNASSRNAIVSDDGRFVAFESLATNLTGFTTSGTYLYMHDTTTGITKLVDQKFDKSAPSTGSYPALEGYGFARRTGELAYRHSGTDLVSGFVDNNFGSRDVFLYNPLTGVNTLVNGLTATSTANNGSLQRPQMSDDGRLIAFTSTASNYPGADGTSNQHVYVRNRDTGLLEFIDVRNSDGKQQAIGTLTGLPFALSPDGRYVAFPANDAALLEGLPDGNSQADIAVRDRLAKNTSVVNLRFDRTKTSNNGINQQSKLTFTTDGSELGFTSFASDLTTTVDKNGEADVFSTANYRQMFVSAPIGTNLTLKREGDFYAVRNDATSLLVAKRNALATESLRLVGLHGNFTIDFSGGPINLPDGLLVVGKAGSPNTIDVINGSFDTAEHLLFSPTQGVSRWDSLVVNYENVVDLDDTSKCVKRFVGDRSGTDRSVNLSASGSTVNITGAGFIPLSFPNPSKVLNLLMSDGNDTVTVGNMGAHYNTAQLAIFGEAGNDTLTASAATHRIALDGGDGNDTLTSGSGNDRLFDGFGNDVLNGGPGNDTYSLTPGSDDTLTDSTGNDTLDFSFSFEPVSIDLDAINKQAVTTRGDRITLTGTFENFIGTAFNDTVSVAALNVPRTINGGPETNALAPGDLLIVNTNGLATTDNGTKIVTAGKADINYTEIETSNLPVTFAVMNANDSGAGSLRQAILDANAKTGLDRIVFEATFFSTPRTITFGSGITITDSVDILGPGKAFVTLNGNNLHSQLLISGTSLTATLTGLTFANGKAVTNGGAINITDETVSIRDSAFNTNTTTGFGGAIAGQTNSRLAIRNSTFTGNTATSGGGAIHSNGDVSIFGSSFSDNISPGDGGALFVSGILALRDSTLSANTAGDDGGAIFSQSLTQIIQSTLSGNKAADGGGIARPAVFSGAIVMDNCTVVNNTATGLGGGLFDPASASRIDIESSIITGNSGTGTQIHSSGETRITRSLLGSGSVLSSNSTLDGFTQDRIGVSPQLGPLANNGGSTLTHLPASTSPAVDAGNFNFTFINDQRGQPRVNGVRVDIGAVEAVSGNLPALTLATFSGNFVGESSQTFTLTFQDDGDIDPTSFDGNDVRVTGPNGFDVAAKLIDDGNFGPPLTPTYAFTPPGGAWDVGDIGTYVIRIQPNQIFDKSGKAVPAGAVTDLTTIFGTTFTVTNANDSGAGSLRQAILDANANRTPDLVNFDPVFFNVPRTILLTSPLSVTQALKLDGPGKSLLTLDGQGTGRVLDFSFNFIQDAIVEGMTISNGKTTTETGGGIKALNANLIVDNVTLTANSAALGGSAIRTEGIGGLTLRNSTVVGNSVVNTGTATIVGGALSLAGNTLPSTIENSLITLNTASVSGASFAAAGGVFQNYGVSLTINRSTISGNSADGDAGGLFSRGAGLTILDSTISGNSVDRNGAALFLLSSTQTVTLRNTTISGNSAATSGGGIHSLATFTGTANIQNSTITANTASTGTVGGVSRLGGSFNLVSTIVAGNVNATSPDVGGTLAASRSLIGNVGTALLTDNGGNVLGTATNPANAKLAALGNNGGPVQTHLPAADSPARNAGSNPANLALDARGQARTQQGFTDIGAVEAADGVPTAFVTAPGITFKGATQTVQVTFSDDVAINASSIGKDDITIVGPGGFSVNPLFVSVDNPSNGTPRTGTFTFTPPGGFWDFADNGTYSVLLNSNQVFDTSAVAVPGQVIGGLFCNLPQIFVVDTALDKVDAGDGKTSLREAITSANASGNIVVIQFDSLLNGSTLTLGGTQLPTITRPMTIAGPGASLIAISGNNASRIFSVDMTTAGNLLTLSGLTLTQGAAAGASGGAIDNVDAALVLQNMILTGNSAGTNGGAINISTTGSAGTLLVEDSVLHGNSAGTGDGGAIRSASSGLITLRRSTLANNIADDEGTAVMLSSAAGQMLVESSTISGNKNTNSSGLAGALYASGSSAFITVRNSTISGNSAVNNSSAIHLTSSAGALIQNSTITANLTQAIGSGSGSTITVESSVVAGNSSGDIGVTTINTSKSFLGNVGTSTVNGTFLTGDPLLGELFENGGPTATHEILPGSPLLDAGSNPFGLAFDQRGFTRTINSNTDIGAVEGIVSIPRVKIAPLANITRLTNAKYEIILTFFDTQGIDVATIGTGDVTVTGPNGFSIDAALVGVAGGNGSPRQAIYQFAPPGGSWDATDDGTYTVMLNANQVFDIDTPTKNAVAAKTLGTFTAKAPTLIVVDTALDTVDGGDGKTSLREAIATANASSSLMQIQFDTALNGGTIVLGGTHLAVSKPVNIVGPGAGLLTISGNNTSRIFEFDMATVGNPALLANLTLTLGKVSGADGGAIRNVDANLTIEGAVITGNSTSGSGGALVAGTIGGITTTILESVISKNTASVNGMGIHANNGGNLIIRGSTISGNSGGFNGGGLLFSSVGTGTLFIENSTIAGNSASTSGGGLRINGTATLRNTTISGNSTSGASGGGGILFTGTSLLSLENSTLTLNSASSGGGFLTTGDNPVLLVSTVVSNNTASTGPDISGKASVDSSFVGDTTGATLIGTPLTGDAKLGALASNGGPTLTHMPASDSPLLGTGSNPLGLPFDARGQNRSFGITDIGAVEVQPSVSVSGFTVNGGAAQRSRIITVTVTFATPVDAATFQTTGAITFTRTAGGPATTVNTTNGLIVSPASGTVSSLTLTFANLVNAGVENGSLADGRWQLSVGPAGFTSLLNDPILRRLFGDADANGTVDGNDFGLFGNALGSSATGSPFDFDNNDTVDGADFAEFGNHFGVTL